jgi:galactokinase
MDQAASVFADRGSALYISFKPLSARPVQFPETDELNFLVAQSFVPADKYNSAETGYNLRVVECSLAAAVLAKIFRVTDKMPSDSSPLNISLRGFHDTFFEQKDGIKDNSETKAEQFMEQLKRLIQMTEDYLPQEEGYTLNQVTEILGITKDELHERFTSKFPVKADQFMLRQRAFHVFSEAIRVYHFMALLDAHASSGSTDAQAVDSLLKDLGGLMNLTQDSCRDIYSCSCPELDELCQIARSAGSYGSRLTGAGWGGCSVHLVPKSKVEKVKEAWMEKFYKRKWPDMSEKQIEQAIVVSRPGSGSTIFKVTGPTVA